MTDAREIEREEVLTKARAAKKVAPVLATLATPDKDAVLHAAADELVDRTDEILAANQKDIEDGKANGLSESLIDRLALDAARVEAVSYTHLTLPTIYSV